MTSTANTVSRKESLDQMAVSSFQPKFALEIMGGGYFVKCNSNEIYEKEFTSTDPWEY